MNFIKTKLKGVYIIEPTVHGDSRGWFMESYNKGEFDNEGLKYNFVQDNQSFSAQKGILRGLHFQNRPMAQAKLVRCTKGAILDVAVDIRKGSDSYLQYVAMELSAENKKQLMIPRGFAHGFVTLTDDVMVQYKADNLYSKENDRGIQYCDKSIGVEWGIDNPILSLKDQTSPTLDESDANFSVKVLVTGVNGQLGHDVVKKLNAENYECLGVDINDFDITDFEMTRNYILNFAPDIIVHCSAYTSVDKAEENVELCQKVNVIGSQNIAKVCKEIDAKLVYISTDYVYNGLGNIPYEVNEKVEPLSTYGKTKLLGELACQDLVQKLFIIRTSWVFGLNGNNFVKTMLKLAEKNDQINVVSDQIGSPTYTPDLADFIFYILNSKNYGIYHCTNEGFCSWYDFACEIFSLVKSKVNVNEIKSSEYKTLAVRPKNSRLSKKSLIECGYGLLPTWQNALDRFLKELTV